MKIKQSLAIAAAALLSASLALAGCSSTGSSQGSNSGTLQVYLSMSSGSAQYTEMKKLVKQFESETGDKVNLTIDSANFENNMKVRMSSRNMPDVFSTHGWSVIRYSKFLEPLNNRSWFKYMDKGLDEAMLDKDGKLYALPLEYTVTGILTNFDVLKQAGVNPDSIKTWDDFASACAKIKADGKTPIVSSGKENGPSGDLANELAANAFSDNELQQFKNGQFLSEQWSQRVYSRIQSWTDKGFFNADYVSATSEDMARGLATGSAAFTFGQPTNLATALTFNKDANIGFIPFPTDGTRGQYLVGGEGVNAYGVTKDSPRKQEALKFIDFLAKPENAKPMIQSIGTYSGLTNVRADLGPIQPSYDKWVKPGKLPTKSFFDRVWLPNGMWSTLVSSSDAVITKQSGAAEATKQMADQFKTLYGQNS